MAAAIAAALHDARREGASPRTAAVPVQFHPSRHRRSEVSA